MEYYLYIDDSGKFEKSKDEYISYSYLLLTKEERTKLCNEYLKIWDLISRSSSPLTAEEKEVLINKFNNKEMRNVILSTQWPEHIKAHDFIQLYNKSIKDKDEEYTKILDKFLLLYKIPTYIGTMTQSKIKSNIKNWDTENGKIAKKRYLILLIISNLIQDNILDKNTTLSIYVDREFNSIKNETLSNEFRKFFNTPLDYNWLKYQKSRKMLNKLRYNEISIKNFSFINSNYSIPIRLSDIIANLSHKYLKKEKNNKDTTIKHILSFWNKNEIFVNLCEFPNFIKSILKNN